MIDKLFSLAFLIIVVALAVSFFRLVKGPHPVDRVICLDLLGISVAGLIAIQSSRSGKEAFLDAVLVLSIIVFISTLVFARFIEGYIEPREGS